VGKNKGKVRSEEFKKRVSETMKAKYQNDPIMRENLAEARKLGLPLCHTPEVKEKARQALIGNPKLKASIQRSWDKRRGIKEK